MRVIFNEELKQVADDLDRMAPVSYTHLDVYKRQIEADGTGATFLVTGFGPDKIHREGLGIIVTPVFFSGRQPGRSGLGFVIAATATVMLHFAYSSWIAELGLSVVDSEDSGAVTFTVFAVHETVISIRPQQVP